MSGTGKSKNEKIKKLIGAYKFYLILPPILLLLFLAILAYSGNSTSFFKYF